MREPSIWRCTHFDHTSKRIISKEKHQKKADERDREISGSFFAFLYEDIETLAQQQQRHN